MKSQALKGGEGEGRGTRGEGRGKPDVESESSPPALPRAQGDGRGNEKGRRGQIGGTRGEQRRDKPVVES